MAKRLTHMQRAERWYAKQVRNGQLRTSDYSFLAKRMTLCYEPATLMSKRNEQTKHDILSANKLIDEALKIKL